MQGGSLAIVPMLARDQGQIINMNFEQLLKLRLVVARIGEMDLAGWWNTKGQMGHLGALALRRGFPRTHFFARARSVFRVVTHRCHEVFDPPHCATLWRLPEDIEEEFDSRWELWLDDPEPWFEFGQAIETMRGNDLCAVMPELGLAEPSDLEAVACLRRSAQGRSVLLPGTFDDDKSVTTALALAFCKGEKGRLVIPYIKLGN